MGNDILSKIEGRWVSVFDGIFLLLRRGTFLS